MSFLFVINSNAQDNISDPLKTDFASVGVGVGLNFGGIGANLLVYPTKNIGLFAGAGYAIAGTGYNVGTKLRLVPSEAYFKIHPYCMLMYGYNTVIAVSNAEEYSKFMVQVQV